MSFRVGMRRYSFYVCASLTLAIGLLVATGCGPGQQGVESPGSSELEEVSVRLPIPVVDTAFAPYYLAQDLGLFEKAGLKVSIEPGSPELNPVRMVDSGVDQFGVVGGPELLMSGRAAGAAIKGVALLHRDANFPIIVTLAESGIDEVEELRGKRIGFFLGHISTDVLRAFLRQEQIDYEEVDVGFNYGPLLSGQLDAEWAFRTTAWITLQEQGVELHAIDPSDHGIVTQGHMVITHERLIQEQPDVVQKYVGAVLAGARHGIEHPNDAIEAATRRDANFSPAVGRKQMQIYNKTILRNDPLGYIPPQTMEEDAQRQKDLGVLRRSFEVDNTFTNRFVEAIAERADNGGAPAP